MVASAKLKIAIVAHPNSGIAHYSYSLAKALSQLEGSQTEILLIVNRAYICNPVPGLKIVKMFSRTRRLPFEALRFIWFVIFQRVDLIHFQNPMKYPLLTWWMILFFRLLRKRTVYTAHDVLPHYARGYHRYLMRRIYNSSDQVIVHSEANRKELSVVAPKARAVEVIPHGIYDLFRTDETLTMQEAREKLGLPINAKVLLFFGRIDERKGAAVLVEDLPKLHRLDPSLHVLMAGAVKLPEGYLESLAKQGGVQDALTIVNEWIADDNVGLYFTAADAVVLPYLEGSTSGVIKVAMAFNKPVIASRVGELPEMVGRCDAGLLVDFPLDNSDANKIVDFMPGPGANTPVESDESADEYEWPNIAAKTRQLYSRLLRR